MNEKIPQIPYEELHFQPITKIDLWRGPWHKEGSWGVVMTLRCGHMKAVSRTKVPKNFVHCVVCTLKARKKKVAA